MDLKNKKILIIEPNSYGGINLLESAKRNGVEVHAVTHKEIYEKQYSNELKRMIDYVFFTDFCKEEKALEDIVEYAKEKNVDGVVAGFEFTSDITVRVANKLGLPSHDIDKCMALRRKDIMHECFVKHGVDCAKTIVVDNIDDCKKAANNIGFPVVIKPSSNAGSCSVFGVNNADELEEAFNSIVENNIEFPHGMKLENKILVQEFLDGREFSVEVVASKGEIYVLSITDKLTTDGHYFAEIGHTMPTNLSINNQEKIARIVKEAAKSVGLKNGIGHIEVKLTATGPKIIEIGARMPGDNIPKLLLYSRGIDEGKVYIETSIGIKPEVQPFEKKYAGIRFIVPEKGGTIKSINGIEAIKNNMQDIYEYEIYTKVGDTVGNPIDNIARIGHIISVSSSYDDVEKKISECLKDLKVEIV